MKLLVESITDPLISPSEAISVTSQLFLNEEECYALLDAVLPLKNTETIHWTQQKLDEHIENVMEKVRNNLLSLDKSINMEDLMHTRESDEAINQYYSQAYVLAAAPVPAYYYVPCYYFAIGYVNLLY